MKKTALITGAYGFIGRHVARYFYNQQYDVIGIGHGAWSAKEYLLWGIGQWHSCDIIVENLVTYGSNPDVIVHCAGSGSVGFSIEHPKQDFERTVETMQSVLEYVRLYSPQTKIVYPSSAAVYGTVDKLPIAEDALLQPISPYGVHKKIAEELCGLYAQQYELSIAIVRLFSVYGRGLRKQLLWDACKKLDIGEVSFYGTGGETRDWVHVEDVASLLYVASEKVSSSCPTVNGGTGQPITIKMILEKVFYAFGRENRPEFLGSTNVGNPTHYQADIRRLNSWGWEPQVSLEQGIEEYVQWYKEGSV